MKRLRLISFVLVSILLLSFAGCNPARKGSDERVLNAIETLEESWDEEYAKNGAEDKYLKIINTRIINIKEDIDTEKLDKAKMFEEIDYVVEFELLSNLYKSSPYYFNAGFYDCVVVYKDGTSECSQSPFLRYISHAYSGDFSQIIESVEELDEQYNRVIDFE